jgi:hypothetical protein
MDLADSYLPTSVPMPELQGKILGFLLEDMKNLDEAPGPTLFIVL